MKTTDEIIRALSVCSYHTVCKGCSYKKETMCRRTMTRDALALIRALIAENGISSETSQVPAEAPEPWTREKILAEAQKCVCGQREQDYGTPEQSFETIGRLWGAYLFGDLSITPHTVAVMMALMKIARIGANPGHMDSWVDLAGYAACGGEIAGKEA